MKGNRDMYKVVDLFAGAGGLSLGFEMTKKFNMLAFVENNDSAARTYLENRKQENIKRYEDIKKIDFSELLKDIGGSVDVVIGGPPCQGFSNANRQKRKIINGNNELVKRYVEAIKQLKPKVFVMENVKTIASNKHLYYLNEDERDYIVGNLQIDTFNTPCTLYEGEYLNKVYELLNYKEIVKKLSISLDSIKLFKVFKKDITRITKFIEKDINVKKINDLVKKLDITDICPDWYRNILDNVIKVLNRILMSCVNEDDIYTLRLFLDIQQAFRGINELEESNILYHIDIQQNQVVAIIETYRIIDYIKRSFDYLGYKIEDKVLNAVEYGVPQKRQRYIMIGMKKELIEDEEIKMPKSLINDKNKYNTVRIAINNLKSYEVSKNDNNYTFKIRKNNVKNENLYSKVIFDSNIIYNHVCTDTRKDAIERFKKIKQGQNFHDLPNYLKDNTYENPSRTQNTIYKRLIEDEPSDTVVNVRKSMWIHPTENRAISQREAARLQSFPDSYKFLGNKDSIYQQIGNAVPPLLGKAIAETVIDLLENKCSKNLLKNMK
ncbi:DNA cytosine methyltransferase [Intestinibacter bartlettii]|uniref:DNA cytosine methyltransferase n=1 Tax=Intestinibacter bartlettii TaxID=261299 RepID=UPI00242A8ACD|nr:DNA cytosine methyltransferase [Intestinibacter bartlettii]MDU6823611.1 DNA cytosine methyltransferase [Intestinibacter bartlettii]